MTNPTLERAARAAFDETQRHMQALGHNLSGWDDLSPEGRESVRNVARAVLMAVRTPDKAIIDAAFCDALEPVYPSDFTRVVDVILADGGE